MVSVLDPGSSSLGASPGWELCVVFLGKTNTFTVPLSNQVCQWVLANLMLEVKPCDGLASHLGGSRNTPSHFMLKKPG